MNKKDYLLLQQLVNKGVLNGGYNLQEVDNLLQILRRIKVVEDYEQLSKEGTEKKSVKEIKRNK